MHAQPYCEGFFCHQDDPWDVFIADDDERDPQPEPGDFWPDDEWTLDVSRAEDSQVATGRWEVLPCSR